MKKVFNKLSIVMVVAVVSFFTSCKKDEVVAPQTPAQSLLSAKTWQMEEVTDYYGGIADKIYKKGASNNQDDYSLVRQKFNANGTITYTDQFGTQGSDGLWELQSNNTKIKLSLPSMGLTVLCDDFTVTANSFSYKLKSSATEYTHFIFSAVP